MLAIITSLTVTKVIKPKRCTGHSRKMHDHYEVAGDAVVLAMTESVVDSLPLEVLPPPFWSPMVLGVDPARSLSYR